MTSRALGDRLRPSRDADREFLSGASAQATRRALVVIIGIEISRLTTHFEA